MRKYKVTFYYFSSPRAALIIEALDDEWLDWFMRRFYPDVSWDYEVIE
jgi:hypothetical protein